MRVSKHKKGGSASHKAFHLRGEKWALTLTIRGKKNSSAPFLCIDGSNVSNTDV